MTHVDATDFSVLTWLVVHISRCLAHSAATNLEKHAVLCFDEMSIKSSLSYNTKNDAIDGFENFYISFMSFSNILARFARFLGDWLRVHL